MITDILGLVTNMTDLRTRAPQPAGLELSPDIVRRLIEDAYGIRPSALHFFSAELATVCRVETPSGALGFKAQRADSVDPTVFAWQAEVQARAAAAGLPAPTPIATATTGQLTAAVHVADETVLLQLYTWRDGMPLSRVLPDERVAREVGRTAARLSVALAPVAPPPRDAGHMWELSRAADTIRRVLPDVADAQIAALARAAADRFEAELAGLSALPHQVVHHDLHDANLLVAQTGVEWVVSGMLDFGDAVWGARVAELAVTAAYVARHGSDPLGAIADVCAGWRDAAPLSEREMLAVLPGAVTRLAVNAAVWASRARGSRAEYARERAAGSTRALAALSGIPTMRLVDLVAAL